MVVRLCPNRHKSLERKLKYELKELKAVTGADRFQVLWPDGSVALKGRAKDVLKLAKRVNGPRVSARDGMAGIHSCPADVTYAMKRGGLIATPREAYRLFRPTFTPVMKAFTRRCVAQTTRNGKKVFVPVIPLFVHSPANNNRAGEVELSNNFFILKKGWDPVGKKWRSIDFDKLMLVQGEAQAAANQALGFALRDKGILCLPRGKSITAFGHTAKPAASAKINKATAAANTASGQTTTAAAAGGTTAQPWVRLKANTTGTKTTAGAKNAGGAKTASPKARKAAAQNIAAKTRKRVVPWRKALRNLKGTVTAPLGDSLSRLLVKVELAAQRRLARGAIRRAFHYHSASGAPRFTEGSVKATAAQLCTPHVRPATLDAVWAKYTAEPAKFGIKEAHLQPNGARVFVATGQAAAEQRVGELVARHRSSPVKGLSRDQVIRATVRSGLSWQEVEDLVSLCGKGGVRWGERYGTNLMRHAAEAYKKSGRNVHVVGDPLVGKSLGRPTFSATGFIDSASRTPHLRALWAGLRSEGLFGDWLGEAGRIRRAKPRLSFKKGDMVVLAPTKGLEDARAVEAVVKLAEKRGAKVVFLGNSAATYHTLTANHGVHP